MRLGDPHMSEWPINTGLCDQRMAAAKQRSRLVITPATYLETMWEAMVDSFNGYMLLVVE